MPIGVEHRSDSARLMRPRSYVLVPVMPIGVERTIAEMQRRNAKPNTVKLDQLLRRQRRWLETAGRMGTFGFGLYTDKCPIINLM